MGAAMKKHQVIMWKFKAFRSELVWVLAMAKPVDALTDVIRLCDRFERAIAHNTGESNGEKRNSARASSRKRKAS